MQLLIVANDLEPAATLRQAGFRVLTTSAARMALRLLEQERPELVVLDGDLAEDGLDLLRAIRRQDGVPVVVLSSRAAEDDKLAAFALGADDYLSKPYGTRELVARIRAVLQRSRRAPAAADAGPLQAGPLVLDPAAHKVEKAGRPLALSVIEFRLLEYLMRRAGTVVPASAVRQYVWGYDDPRATDLVRLAVFRLRRKIEDDPAHPRLLHTLPGVGLLLQDDQPAAACNAGVR